jgi:hypothetical protein
MARHDSLSRKRERERQAPAARAFGTIPSMGYMLLIMEPRGQRRERTEAEGRELYARMVRFGDALKSRGLLRATESLQTDDHATRVQVRNGRPTLLDGPYAEAKEMVGGFYLLTCDTREEALAIARECPAAEWATVEVRALAPCYET